MLAEPEYPRTDGLLASSRHQYELHHDDWYALINLCHELENESASKDAAIVKLVGALDLLRESLQGGNVEDLIYTINQALDESKSC